MGCFGIRRWGCFIVVVLVSFRQEIGAKAAIGKPLALKYKRPDKKIENVDCKLPQSREVGILSQKSVDLQSDASFKASTLEPQDVNIE